MKSTADPARGQRRRAPTPRVPTRARRFPSGARLRPESGRGAFGPPALFLLISLLLCTVVAAQPQPPDLQIFAPEALTTVADRIRGYDRARLVTAMRLAGLDEPGPPIRVVLAEERSEAARAVQSWVAGYARGYDGLVVLFPGRAPTYPDDSLEELLHHEVCHVLIARAAHGWPVPRWFNEGVAMAAGRAWSFGDSTRYALEVLRSGRVRLDDLDPLFAGGSSEAARAYAVAGAFVRDLLDRFGPDVTGDILRRVGEGVSFAAAFRAATGTTLAAAEETYWRRETFWRRWVPFLTSSAVLWIAVTLLALWAFERRRQRDAELARRWEWEEGAAAAPTRWSPAPADDDEEYDEDDDGPLVN